MLPRTLIGASLRPFILSILSENPSYGYEITQRVHELTDGKIRYTTSTLYPVLHSLENDGLLKSYWHKEEGTPRRKYYRLTTEGKAAFRTERRQWMDVNRALTTLWNSPSSSSLATTVKKG